VGDESFEHQHGGHIAHQVREQRGESRHGRGALQVEAARGGRPTASGVFSTPAITMGMFYHPLAHQREEAAGWPRQSSCRIGAEWCRSRSRPKHHRP
jgi:hypothetical protein